MSYTRTNHQDRVGFSAAAGFFTPEMKFHIIYFAFRLVHGRRHLCCCCCTEVRSFRTVDVSDKYIRAVFETFAPSVSTFRNLFKNIFCAAFIISTLRITLNLRTTPKMARNGHKNTARTGSARFVYAFGPKLSYTLGNFRNLISRW